LATDKVIISIDEVRELVQFAAMASSVGSYRIVVIEDADRMSERTSNVLLKALEEPQENTVWMLCAPSAADLLPTIRSRTRNVSLRLPSNQEVAQLLVQRDGVTEDLAIQSARQAQQHVGMARRLALSQDARARRQETMRELASITNLSGAMAAAEHLLNVAKRDAETVSAERDKQEKDKLLSAYGLGPEDKVPPGIRSHIKELEDNQKRRNTRALRDGIDRVFTDAESFIRDALSIQLGTYSELINSDLLEVLNQRAVLTSSEQSVEILDAIKKARVRLESNVRDLLVLEALCTTLIMRRQVAA